TCDESVEQRVEHREPEDGIIPQPFVMLDPDECAGPADLGVGERNPDAQPKRIGQEEDQEPHRRQHEPETEPVAVGLDLVPRGGFADLRLGYPWLERDVSHGRCPELTVVGADGDRPPSAPGSINDRCASTAVRLLPWRFWHPWRRCSSWQTYRP